MDRDELKQYIGHQLTLTATRGSIAPIKGNIDELKLCIENVMLDGIIVADHMWIDRCHRVKKLESKQRFKFTAIIGEYIGLNSSYEQITKIKLDKVRNVNAL